MKKVITMLLCFMMFLSFSIPAYAVEKEKDNSISSPIFCADVISEMADSIITTASESKQLDLDKSFYLYSFNEEPVAIFYQLTPVGYAIYDFIGTTVLEYTTEYNHPFYTNPSQRYYYEGVFCYYEAVENGFKDLASEKVKTVDKDYYFSSESFYHNADNNESASIRASENPVYLDNPTRLYNCNHDSNMSYFYPELSQEERDACPGVCGSVASAILIAYYDDYHSDLGDFVDNSKKTAGQAESYAYGKTFVKELISYIEPNGNGSLFLNPGVSSYLADRGISGRVALGILAPYQQTKNAIGDDGTGDPIIIGTSKHYSVGIGYKNITQKQIFTNTGHGYASWINANTVISTWTMHVD